MNVEELSMIGPNVDLETVDAISKKRLLAFINHFIINTSLFLNKLSKSCEHGLMLLENKIQKLESSIIILESKLNSVPGLDVHETAQPLVPDLEPKLDKNEENNTESKQEQVSEVESNPIKEEILNPAYMKYVKMLKIGVPLPAVKLEMKQDGVDSSLHDSILNCKDFRLNE